MATQYSGLYGPNGRPLQSGLFKKENPPKTGPAYGEFGGDPVGQFTRRLPGGAVTQFDLTKLTLEDFRNMRQHPSVNTSLSVLSFMQHQSAWKVVHPDKKVVEACTQQLEEIWTQLNRAMAQANWAGYSPNALEWDNDINGRVVSISKVKDLIPENCVVNWKEIKGYAPPGHIEPRFEIYDGIKQYGQPTPIPKENTFWYALMAENGNMYGRKLLQAAFTPWYFSMLMHIYANRYYERFGEPTAIGRAPFDETAPNTATTTNPTGVNGQSYMLQVMQNLRSRGVTVLPNDGHQDSGTGKYIFDYDISFLESQMRGADFERYMTRLDEEISLALFTPTLLFRVADVGSYNLGQGHMQVYLWMINSMNSDRSQYINKYILSPFTDYNFSSKIERPKIVFKKLGDTDSELVKSVLTAMVNQGSVKPDLEALGEMVGMKLTAVKQTLAPDGANDAPPASTSDTTGSGADNGAKPTASTKAGKDRDGVVTSMLERVIPQVFKIKKTGTYKDLDFGFQSSLATAFYSAGVEHSQERAQAVVSDMVEFASFLDWDNEAPSMLMARISEKLNELVFDAA